MKILFYTNDQTACRYLRVELPKKYLSLDPDILIETTPVFLPSHFYEWDIVVFHKNVLAKDLDFIKRIKDNGRKVVYEADDDYFNIPPWNQVAYRSYQHVRQNIEKILKASDAITVTTKHLADQYSKYNPRTYVLPNSLDIAEIDSTPINTEIVSITDGYGSKISHSEYLDRTKDLLRVGYYGSATHVGDLKLLVRPLGIFLREKDASFTFVGNLPQDLRLAIPKDKLFTVYPTTIDKYISLLKTLELDTVLVPIQDISFNRSKSNLKVIESMAIKVVPVASYAGEYVSTITNGKNGYLCRTTDEWISNLTSLLDRSNLNWIRAAGFDHVSKHFDIRENYQLWKNAYQQILGETKSLVTEITSSTSEPGFWNKIWREEGINTWRSYPAIYDYLDNIIKSDSSVIDVGCGPGQLAYKIQHRVDITCLDFSKEIVNLVPNAVVSNIATYTSTKKYDYVVCTEVLHYTLDPKTVALRLSNLVGNGGTVFISVPDDSFGEDFDSTPTWRFTTEKLDYLLRPFFSKRSYVVLDGHILASVGKGL